MFFLLFWKKSLFGLNVFETKEKYIDLYQLLWIKKAQKTKKFNYHTNIIATSIFITSLIKKINCF